MKEIKKITKPQDMCIGQLYMYLYYGKLKRGFCKKIEENEVSFRVDDYLTNTMTYIETRYPEIKYNYIAEYNAKIYNKYLKLQERHKKECEDCLNGKYVYTRKTPKEKWYNRFFRKRK